ncbi:MAG: YebC/PmpR family DNA-binding transcriptional regulator [bacterium]
MAGHSKWANIKHKKAKVDAQKGAVFAKFSREILVAAKCGGANPDGNFRLRTALDKAKSSGMPNDNIKRLLDKIAGAGANDNTEDVNYEGYGPGGVAILIETVTDNRNRTAGDIRSYFNKNHGNLGETGCVGWMFKEEGQISIDKENINQEDLFDAAINAGADDLIEEDENYKVITSVESMQEVAESIEKAGYKIKSAERTRTAENTINVEDAEIAKYLMRLLDSIENHEDVQNVYSNFDMEDSLLESLS